MIGSVVHDWFGWPDGAVLTNLIASLVWGVVAWRKIRKLHKHVLGIHDHLGVGKKTDELE